MIRRIRGTIVEVDQEAVLLRCGDICYEVFVTPITADRMAARAAGAEVEFHTFHYLQVDQSRSVPVLMGFERSEHRDFFEALLEAPRFGPKSALRSIAIPVSNYAKAIEIGDTKTLKSLPGVGPGTAKNLVAQLQGKMARFIGAAELEQMTPATATTIESDVHGQAIQILIALGVSESDATQAVLRLQGDGAVFTDPEQIVKTVLKR